MNELSSRRKTPRTCHYPACFDGPEFIRVFELTDYSISPERAGLFYYRPANDSRERLYEQFFKTFKLNKTK